MFKKILIANRGEIALRIIRACRDLGVKSVLVFSEADRSSLPVQLADEAYCIGPSPSGKSYLNVTNIISTALVSGAEAVHPGYGFLAENSRFAEVCEANNLVFIGPSAGAIAKMGDKALARETMIAAGVPVVQGSGGILKNVEEAVDLADNIGYPVMIKASAGGGGRGMRVAQDRDDLSNAILTAQTEARAAFGSTDVYLEKYVEEPRHVEIQIMGDKHGQIVYLGERDCSIQRRNQKIIEEAPSPALTPELREKMGQAAILAAQSANYYNAGTVEFLLDRHGDFYFIEMNTRIQVEHPITEMVTGIDLVAEQIRVAAGLPLTFRQEDISINGWSIECRINAEDPDRNYTPCPGTITTYLAPGGPGVRIDSAAYAGWTVPPYYDSMVGKLIVWGKDREEAIRRMERALHEFRLEGIKTTISLHQKILRNAFFRRGDYYTNFIHRRILGK